MPGCFLFVLAVVMLVLFTLGLPLFFAWLLWFRRKAFLTHESIEWIGFLYVAYKEQFFWWEIWGFARRLILISVITFVEPEKAVLPVLVVFLVALVAQMWLHPFRYSVENWMEVFSIGSLIVLQIANSISESGVDEAPEISAEMSTVQQFIVGFNAAVFLVFIAALLLPMWGQLSILCRNLCIRIETGQLFGSAKSEKDRREEDYQWFQEDDEEEQQQEGDEEDE